jgi:hypothetical protein
MMGITNGVSNATHNVQVLYARCGGCCSSAMERVNQGGLVYA